MAATQRPISEVAFGEPTGVPAWKSKPAWAVITTGDKTIGADAVRFMAKRSGAKITEVDGSHVIMISKPDVVTEVILTAIDEASGEAAAAKRTRPPAERSDVREERLQL